MRVLKSKLSSNVFEDTNKVFEIQLELVVDTKLN